MSEALKEFSINLPMVGVPPMTMPPELMPAPITPEFDVTSAYEMPADVGTCCSHIQVSVEGASASGGYSPEDPKVCIDMILNVCITNPETGQCSTYKLVKRLAMDKAKLACQVEGDEPYQVVEATTPEQQAKVLAEQKAAARARELAGLPALPKV